MQYRVEAEKVFLRGELGYAFDLSADFERARSVKGLGSSAHAFLGTAVRCTLVGFDSEATQLLEKSRQWLEAGIAVNEQPQKYFPDGTEASRYQDLAICNWLARGAHDLSSLRRFVEHEDAYLNGTSAGRDKMSVSLVLSGYLDAGANERVRELVEVTPGMSPPRTPSRPRGEAAMAYVTALRRLGELDESTATTAANRFLEASAGSWLKKGHYLRFANWVKILRWTSRSLQPAELLRRSLPGSVAE